MSKSSHLLSKQNSQQPKQFRGGEKKVMKKSLSLLVAIAMVFSMFATLVSADGKAAGQKLQDLGIIKGTSAGLDEDKEWLRQDVTVLLSRLLGAEETAKATANTHGFADLDSTFYNGYVSWAKEKGYFNGETDTRFGVNNPITNQQFAAVLLRVLNVDVEYAEAFEKAVELKLVSADLDKAANAVRGNIYESLVTALDYKIDGKKLGTILGLKGYEVNAVEVVKATATNSKTVVVEFNQDVKDVVANSFVVTNADGGVQVIESVSTSGAKATLKLNEKLTNEKTYTVSVAGIEAKEGEQVLADTVTAEFTYNATTAATIEIPVTSVAFGKTVGIVIKDANGVDITDNYDLSELEVQSSATNIVSIDGDNNLVARDTEGYSVVNATLTVDADEDKTIETGNVIITVKSSVDVVNGFDEMTLGVIGEDAVTSLHVGETDKSIKVTVKNADGSKNDTAAAKATFKSGNPSVLVVDANSGEVTPIKAGSATVTATTTFNGKTITKSVVITVKDAAKFTSIELDKTSVKLVYGLGADAITEKVKVTLKDQFGEDFKADGQAATVRANKDAELLVGITKTSSTQDIAAATLTGDSSFEVELTVENAVEAANTVNVTVQVGDIKKTISVGIVKQGNAAGYVASIDNLKIDANAGDEKYALKEKEAEVTVYAKDSNGNKVKELAVGTGSELYEVIGDGKDIVSITGNKITAGTKTGTEKVTVLVNGVRVATYNVTVVDTTAVFSKVSQVLNAVNVRSSDTNSLEQKLFGYYDNDGKFVKGAFVAHDQYGTVVDFDDADVTVHSSDKDVVEGKTPIEKGTAVLTVVVNINGTVHVYTITVNVLSTPAL